MHHSTAGHRLTRLLGTLAITLVVTSCGSSAPSEPSASAVVTTGPTDSATFLTSGPATSAPAEPSPSESQAPDTGGGTGAGDIPDDAVFLTYQGTSPSFSIQYVEGWQVTQRPGGVVMRDKDSSETVSIVGPQADVPGYVASTDLPGLRAQSGFKLVKQDTVNVGSSTYLHLVYHLPAPLDPVTGTRC